MNSLLKNLELSDFNNGDEVSCNFCRKKDTRIFRDKWIETLQSRFKFVQCNSCRLIYLNPRPSLAALRKLYSSQEYFEGKEKSIAYYDYLKEENFRRKTAQMKLHEIEKIKGKKGNLLEIGCAAGFFLMTARDFGWDVTGIDISQTMAHYALEKYDLNIIVDRLEDIDPLTHPLMRKNHFDVIYCWGTIGTFSDPLKNFVKIRDMLKDDGLFIFNASNSNSVISRLLKNKWFILGPSALHVYNRGSLKTLLNQAGFSLQKMHVAKEYFTPHKILTKLSMVCGHKASLLAERLSQTSWAHRLTRLPNFGMVEIHARKKPSS